MSPVNRRFREPMRQYRVKDRKLQTSSFIFTGKKKPELRNAEGKPARGICLRVEWRKVCEASCHVEAPDSSDEVSCYHTFLADIAPHPWFPTFWNGIDGDACSEPSRRSSGPPVRPARRVTCKRYGFRDLPPPSPPPPPRADTKESRAHPRRIALTWGDEPFSRFSLGGKRLTGVLITGRHLGDGSSDQWETSCRRCLRLVNRRSDRSQCQTSSACVTFDTTNRVIYFLDVLYGLRVWVQLYIYTKVSSAYPLYPNWSSGDILTLPQSATILSKTSPLHSGWIHDDAYYPWVYSVFSAN